VDFSVTVGALLRVSDSIARRNPSFVATVWIWLVFTSACPGMAVK
jgi:hypothetical protein